MARQVQSNRDISASADILLKKKLKERTFLPVISLLLVFIFTSLVRPGSAQIIPVERNPINGNNIINTPNHNSSSNVPNMPFVEIPRNKLVRIGHICEVDSDCGNFSVCVLKKREDDNALKICECDHKEMMRINQTCYVKPGHQCYFPNMNSHGYRFVDCLPGSKCRKSVNPSRPDQGYCMCEDPNLDLHDRDLNVEFEMAQCTGSTLMGTKWSLAVLLLSAALLQVYNYLVF